MEYNKVVGNKIYAARKARGMTRKELGKILSLHESTIKRYEDGDIKQLDIEKMVDFANALRVDPTYLMGWEEDSNLKLTPPTSYVKIPVYGAIACGTPIEAINDVIDYATIPASWLDGGQEYFCLTATGDSMAPLIEAGDIVVIRKQPTCENGQICAVFVNGYDATLKKVYRHGKIITLQPLNSAYEPQSFEVDGDIEIQILGVMVELRKRFI